MTLLQIISIIKKISLSQPNIHSFVGEFLDLNDVTAKYSAIILQQRTHRRNNDFMTHSFYLGYADRLNEDKSNEVEVQSTAIQVIDDIVYKLENLNLDCTVGVYNTFTQRFLAEAAGGYVELDITVPTGECEDDFAEEKLDATITADGEYNFIPKGLGFQSVHLNVDVARLQDKSLDITKNGNYQVKYDKGYSGLGTVNIDVAIDTDEYYDKEKTDGIVEGQELQKAKLTDISITENGTYEREDGYKSVEVNIPTVNNQEKSITITENGTTSITPDTDYTGLSKVDVTVNVSSSGECFSHYSPWSGNVDEAGLKKLYWHFEYNNNISEITDNPIKRFQANVWWHNWQDDDFKVSDYDKKLDSLTKEYVDDNLIRYPKGRYISSTAIIRFQNCENLIAIPEYGCANVKDFSSMCFNCPSLKYVPKLDTSNGTNFSKMFVNCTALTDIPIFDLSKGQKFTDMFRGCSSLTTIPLFDTSNIENFSRMFAYCDGLTVIPRLDTSKGQNFSGMFRYATNLTTVPALNTSNGTNFSGMFSHCSKLTSISSLNYKQGTDFSSMFEYCTALKKIGVIYALNGTNFKYMFEGCSSLKTIENMTVSNGTDFTKMFYGCTELEDIFFASGSLYDTSSINASIDFDDCVNLTDKSIKSILRACSNTTNTDEKTVSFPERTIAKTDELAVLVTQCTSKGWTVTGLKII